MEYESIEGRGTPAQRFEYLRERYSAFLYKGYRLTESEDRYHVEYDFEIEGLSEFVAKWDFPKWDAASALDGSLLGNLFFLLGMVESISYYKITCPRMFKIISDKSYALDHDQCLWWRKLLYNGLGEFMYRNGIVRSEDELVDIICKCASDDTSDVNDPLQKFFTDKRQYEGCLVPVGGGKDSVVSLELLKGGDIVTYTVNGNDTTRAVISICEHKSGDYVAKRVLDKRMLTLNSLGYLNGHTPFSAIVAFSSMIAAYITGKRYIVLSNETSANESTVKDSFVNHQYSKSFEFEQDFNSYIRTVTDSDISYFSMLRPLSELQIAALFSKDTVYHKAFRSCNAGSKQGIWCCNCPKCLFVYIILSPFLSDDSLKGIFGENLLDKESLDKDFRELIGIEDNKPFECVGTRREVGAAMRYYRAKGRKSLLTDRYADYIDSIRDDIVPMLDEWVDDNNVPDELCAKIKAAINAPGGFL